MKFSVIVPIYNSAKYLLKCVESILNQTFKDIELILIDDGSTDGSEVICDEVALKDSRIIVRHQKNSGVLSAFNAGIKIASGEYLSFIDSDDYVDNDLYEKCYCVINEYNCDTVIFGYKTHNNGNEKCETLGIATGLYDDNSKREKIYPSLINKGSFENRSCVYLSRINKVIRRDILLQNSRYFTQKFFYGEDNLCAITSVLDSKKIYVFSDYFPYHYIINSNSITHSYHNDLWNQFIRLNELTIKILQDKQAQNLIQQVYSDSVFHAAIAINNVMRSLVDYKEKVNQIKTICNSAIVRKGIQSINKNQLSSAHKILLFLIKHKSARVLYFIKRKRSIAK